MDYKNGKIYCIYNYINNEIYVGSTCQTLSKRMAEHRQQLNCMKAKHRNLYKSMNEHGSENFYIELYEEYPCENKAQLQRREGEVIREVGTLNKKIEGRTRKEYYEDNFEILNTYKNTKKTTGILTEIIYSKRKENIVKRTRMKLRKRKNNIWKKTVKQSMKGKDKVIMKTEMRYYKNKRNIQKEIVKQSFTENETIQQEQRSKSENMINNIESKIKKC